MDDLLLWRMLVGHKPLADEHVPLLEELPDRPQRIRWPYAGRLIALTRDPRPRVRTAAMRGLSGMRGHEACRAIVRGLDDPEPAVAAAAVESLRAASGDDPLRMIHALFHADAAVRVAALTGPLPDAARGLVVHLLADDACVAQAIAALPTRQSLPASAAHLILDAHARGRMSSTVAGPLLDRIEIDALLRFVAHRAVADAPPAAAPLRGIAAWEATLDELRTAGGRPGPLRSGPGRDRFGDVIDLMVRTAAAAVAAPCATAIDRLVQAVPRLDPSSRTGVAVAATHAILARPRDEAVLVRFLVAAWPAAVLWRWLERDAVRAALAGFVAMPVESFAGHPPHGLSAAEWLEAIRESDLLRDSPAAPLHLGVLAGLARFLGDDPLGEVMKVFSTAEIAAALADARSAVFLAVPGDAGMRLRLVESVRGTDRTQWPRRLAHLVPFFSQPLLGLLDTFTPQEAVLTLSILQRLDPPPAIRNPRGRRMKRVAETLGRLVAGVPPRDEPAGVHAVAGGIGPQPFVIEVGGHVTPAGPAARQPAEEDAILEFIEHWRTGPRGPVDPLLRAVFLAACAAVPETVISRRLAALDAAGLRFLLLEQFADDALPVGLEEVLTKALAAGVSRPAESIAAILGSAGVITTALNRVWAALVGGANPSPPPSATARGAPDAAPAAVGPGTRTLTPGERTRLGDAPASGFPGAVMPWERTCTLGLAEALAARTGPQPRGVEAATAILMCHDPLPAIDVALAGFMPEDPATIAGVDVNLVSLAGHRDDLPWHAHAWLWRWDRHRDAATAILEAQGRTLADIVADVARLRCGILATRVFEFVRETIVSTHGRATPGGGRHATAALAEALVLALAGPWAAGAAAVLVAWNGLDPDSTTLGAWRLPLLTRLPRLARDVRRVLEPWVSSYGLEEDGTPAADGSLRREFDACLRLVAATGMHHADRAVECVVAETGPAWFTPDDWDRLVATGFDPRLLARRLAVARQPHAYTLAVETLLTEPEIERDDLLALEAFLGQGDSRLAALRVAAARMLHAHGHTACLPLLLSDETGEEPRTPRLFAGLVARTATDVVRAALAGGTGMSESMLLELLLHDDVRADALVAGLRTLLVEGTVASVRNLILRHLARSSSADERLHRVAASFAWGIRRGLELTGKLFTVSMIGGDEMGYTRLEEPRVFVNPMPILREDRNGEAVVRGLVIHEIGHHMYHGGEEMRRVADEARAEDIFPLLNLVEDEHLERNLRALDPAMGDPLKRLAAYAFQHCRREQRVDELLDLFEERAFDMLSRTRLGVAVRPGRVVVQTRRVLAQLESAGNSFARFVRALRMGLGSRGADSRMLEALALFGSRFRRSSAARLLEIARELRRIFGDEVRALQLLGDLDDPLAGQPGDGVRVGEGVTDAGVQQEVARVLASSDDGADGGPRRPALMLNTSPDEEFARIDTVVHVPFDPAKSLAYRGRVRRQAAMLRRCFLDLGVASEPQRHRMRGHTLDRGRLLALAVRGEPRVMVARRLVPRTDLFLGVAVDCSGSMEHGGSIEKARLFGELLAESGRGCGGIDVRIRGFTDTTILDAGSAARCAAHNLEAGGGNNDAAGLWHLACEALASRRRAKLLVMISDGLPTECSVAALRRLVAVLTRRHGICCAQVAVRPLEEECFPIHVDLREDDLDAAVAAFGKTVVGLVRRALVAGG